MREDKDPTYRELIAKQILGSSVSLLAGQTKIKDVLSGLASLAGTGKDEIVSMVCKEIGQATANTLKEPLNQIMGSKKLQITVELVSNDNVTSKSS